MLLYLGHDLFNLRHFKNSRIEATKFEQTELEEIYARERSSDYKEREYCKASEHIRKTYRLRSL